LSLRAGFLLTLLLPPSVSSQESLVEIEVIGRKVNLLGDALSASEGRVSFLEMRQRPILRVGDVLETVPGLVATQHSGSGKANQLFLRGFNLDHGTDFATSIDGMPVNLRSHGHGQGYTDLNFIIPEMVQEILYRKGPYYAEVGDFSGAGSAKFVTRDNAVDSVVQLGAGEFGYTRALAMANARGVGGDLVFALEHQRYDGPWENLEEDVGKTNLQLKHFWQGESGETTLSLMAYRNGWNAADQIPGRAVRSGLLSKFGSLDTTTGGESSRYSLSLSSQSEIASGDLSVNVFAIDYDMDLYSNVTYFTSSEGDQFKQIDSRRIYGGNITLESEQEWASQTVINTFGADVRLDDINEVGLLSTSGRRIRDTLHLDRVNESSLGVFWQSELNWTDRLRTVAGVRYDRFWFDVKALDALVSSTLMGNSGKTDDGITTASLHTAYRLGDSQELYASLGSGFHSNDARGTVISRDPTTGAEIDPVDGLVPTRGAELGWRVYLTDRLNATVALWQLDIDSELVFVGDAGSTEDTGASSERAGAELSAYYQLSNAVGLDFEYAQTKAQFTAPVDGSYDVPGALDRVISAGVNYQPNDRFFTHLRFRYFGDYPLAGGQRAAGSSMTNLRLGYEVSDSIQLSLDLLNLFDSDDHDVEYFYPSQLIGEPGPVDDHHYHVFEPRALRLYLQFQL
jgi:hypothetical protein